MFSSTENLLKDTKKKILLDGEINLCQISNIKGVKS